MNENEAQQLMDAVNAWTAADCVDCAAHFTNPWEAFEHGMWFVNHLLLHLFTARAVN